MFEDKALVHHKGKYYGLYRGYVYDNKDPKHLGRLKLCIPSVYGTENGKPLVSGWAYPMFPVVGNGYGLQYIPPVKNPDGSNVLVWVAFEMGNKNNPVWCGGPISLNGMHDSVLENQKHRLNGETSQSIFSFSTPNGLKIVMDDANGNIILESSAGKITIGDGIKIEAHGNIILEG